MGFDDKVLLNSEMLDQDDLKRAQAYRNTPVQLYILKPDITPDILHLLKTDRQYLLE